MTAQRLWIMIYLSHCIDPCFPGIIDTSTSNQYKSKTIYCTEGEDCTVICDKDEACYNSNIQCPIHYSCNIQCLADYSIGIHRVCENATINCTYSNQCDVSCLNEDNHPLYFAYACKDATFNWPNNKQYTLKCVGGGNCYGAVIDAPFDNEPFTLDCGIAECQNTVINCPNNSTCNVNCDANYACQDSIINCGTDVNADCYVDCVSHSACDAATVNGKGIITKCTGLAACRSTMFPEPPSEKDYTLVCDGSSYVCKEANIKCPLRAACYITCGVSGACTNASITWPSDIYDSTLICVDDSSCMNVDIPPTKNPSIVPTQYPSMITTEKASDTVTMFVLENGVKEEERLMDTLMFKLLVLLVIGVLIVLLCAVIIILERQNIINNLRNKQQIEEVEMIDVNSALSEHGGNFYDIKRPGGVSLILGEESGGESDEFEVEARQYTKTSVDSNTQSELRIIKYDQSISSDGCMTKTALPQKEASTKYWK